jgi:hypothetical protein
VSGDNDATREGEDRVTDGLEAISVETMYGARTRRPFVMLRVKDVYVNVTPATAREVGGFLFDVAAAAEADAALIAMLDPAGTFALEHVAAIVTAFREARERLGQGGT